MKARWIMRHRTPRASPRNVNYLKYDNCFHQGRFGYSEVSFNRYNMIWKALNATGRPILYSLCNWGEDYVHTGRCRLPIPREFLETSTILSIDPTICVAAQTQQVPTVSLQAVTAPFSTPSTRSLPTLTEASIADGATWICLKPVLVA
jgi:hypothetical protein